MTSAPENASSPYSSLRKAARLSLASLPFPIAATSFVYPGTVGLNAEKLTDVMPEMGLCLFEAESCLAYTDEDLPPAMAGLPLKYHVHLPLDFDWQDRPDRALDQMAALTAKCAFLSPWCWVLHPPGIPGRLDEICASLEKLRIPANSVLIENIEGNDLAHEWDAIRDNGLSICLDIGHILAYGQETILKRPGLWERTRMIHACAPGPNGRHESLCNLDPRGRKLLASVLDAMAETCTVTLEVFSEADLVSSLEFLHNIVTGNES